MKPISGRPLWVRILVIVGIPVLFLAAVWMLLSMDPLTGPGLVPCFFHEITGYYCTGCGITRALVSLLHGRIADALSFNAWALIWLAFSGWIALGIWLEALLGRPIFKKPQNMRFWLYSLLISALLFLFLRNLPWLPFRWLAP
ncbi:MAG: DUF2752 domain-containing protein [Eubacteriales bacterium]|nr:DUF2752 domain-containing protein [Eubacteriales bacterium]